MNALFHPRVALASEFLGYTQPRVTAPYSYPNTWGNAYGLLLPFFLFTWFGRAAGWRRYVAPLILLVSFIPVVYSLNRGLWLGLAVSRPGWSCAAWSPVTSGPAGRRSRRGGAGRQPRGHPARARPSRPGSPRRTVTSAARTPWSRCSGPPGSPRPSWATAGPGRWSATSPPWPAPAPPGCHQCSAPPLGTQGFLWGLVFMTGFVGRGADARRSCCGSSSINARRRSLAGAARVDGAPLEHLLLPVLRRPRPADAGHDDDRRAGRPRPLAAAGRTVDDWPCVSDLTRRSRRPSPELLGRARRRPRAGPPDPAARAGTRDLPVSAVAGATPAAGAPRRAGPAPWSPTGGARGTRANG